MYKNIFSNNQYLYTMDKICLQEKFNTNYNIKDIAHKRHKSLINDICMMMKYVEMLMILKADAKNKCNNDWIKYHSDYRWIHRKLNRK